jgi:hypothetical protein
MWTYNCARVYVGDYSVGTNEFCRTINCNYQIVKGNITAKRLKPIIVRPDEEEVGLCALETFALYPVTDTAIIRIINSKGSHLVKLIKRQQGSRSTILKARL